MSKEIYICQERYTYVKRDTHTHRRSSREDETRNGQRNAHRNPEWWGDFSPLQIQIRAQSQFEFVP